MLELKKAGFHYGDRQILTDVNLHLSSGSFHFLTGPSGSGKTTLMKLCYQALFPTSGTMHAFGKDVRAMDRDDIAVVRQRVGVVHQDCKFLDHLSVSENIMLPLQVAGRDVSAGQSNLAQLLSWTGLEERAHALPPELSGGERQRAALARAVILSPEVIIADEPTGNIDWAMAQQLLTLLLELNKMGKTVLIATHDMNLIRAAKSQVSTRVMRLQGGRLHVAGADL